jgi:hypothetical protein
MLCVSVCDYNVRRWRDTMLCVSVCDYKCASCDTLSFLHFLPFSASLATSLRGRFYVLHVCSLSLVIEMALTLYMICEHHTIWVVVIISDTFIVTTTDDAYTQSNYTKMRGATAAAK